MHHETAESVLCRSILVVLLALCSCTPLRRTRDCKRIVDTINPRLDRAEALAQDAGTAAQYEEIATAYTEIGDSLANLSITDPKLKQAAEDYRGLAQGSARHCQKLAQDLQRSAGSPGDTRGHARQLRQLRAQARRHVTTQDAIVRSLNELCHPK